MLLASKQMYHAVLPTMYRRVSFEIDSSVGTYRANYKLWHMADKENQGLLHIEEVHLYPRDELRRNPSVTADYPDANRLLSVIPKNQLRRFNWDSSHHMPPEILRLLWERQHRLTNIELIPCTKPLDQLIDALDLRDQSFYEHATELSVADVGWGTIPAVALRVLKERVQIDTLTLNFRSIEDSMTIIERAHSIDLDHQSRAIKRAQFETLREASHEGLLKELFCPPKQLQPAVPLTLGTLHLHRVDLTNAPRSLVIGLDMKSLRTLHVVSCNSPHLLLEAMSQLPMGKRPRLREFHIYQDDHVDSIP
ncbi:MAG: hypothetical protein Q9169_007306, partial [Polycauliona sp. 2 TL-2023]